MAHSPLMHRERLQRLLDRVETKLKKDPWLAEVKAGRRTALTNAAQVDDRKITGEKCFTSNLSVVTSGGLSP